MLRSPPLPPESTFLTSAWKQLVALSWEVDPGVLEGHVPAGLELDDFSRQKVDASVAELVEERDTVQQLGLLGS